MTEWSGLFQHYESPPYVLPHTSRAHSFGIAGQSSLPVDLLIGGSRVSRERLCPFGLQALGLESPFTGTGLDLLRSSTERRWMTNWIFALRHTDSDTKGSSSVHTALVLLPTQAGASL